MARYSDGAWTNHEVAWPISRLVEHPDGSILAVGDGLWTLDDGR